MAAPAGAPNKRPLSVSRVYANVNLERPRSYWDYENYNPTWK
jgi:hypothetical protein